MGLTQQFIDFVICKKYQADQESDYEFIKIELKPTVEQFKSGMLSFVFPKFRKTQKAKKSEKNKVRIEEGIWSSFQGLKVKPMYKKKRKGKIQHILGWSIKKGIATKFE